MESLAKKNSLDPEEPGFAFAIALSNGLKNEFVRTFVKENLQEEFDGDVNFLYYTAKDKSLGGENNRSLTFEEVLFGVSTNFKTTGLFLEFDPLMQIALRGGGEQLLNIDEIDVSIPVLYISPSQNLKENPVVPMITSNVVISEWDIRNIPQQPVLVIGQNERLVKVAKNPSARLASFDACLQSATPYFSDGTNDYYFYTDYFCGGLIDNPIGGGSGGGTSGCDRDLNNKSDKLDRARFESMFWMREAEGWLDGRPEVYYIMFTGSSLPHLAQLPPKSLPIVDRSKWKDCGVFSCDPEWVLNINLEMFNWDPQLYGRAVTVRFYEYDPGDSETRTQSVTVKDAFGNSNTFSSTWSVSNNDFDLFGTPVDYCDDATGSDLKIYTTGRFLFGMTIDE